MTERQVVVLEGDLEAPDTAERLVEALGGKADVLLSDAAPKITGVRDTDRANEERLLEAIEALLPALLRPGRRPAAQDHGGARGPADREAAPPALRKCQEREATGEPQGNDGALPDGPRTARGLRGRRASPIRGANGTRERVTLRPIRGPSFRSFFLTGPVGPRRRRHQARRAAATRRTRRLPTSRAGVGLSAPRGRGQGHCTVRDRGGGAGSSLAGAVRSPPSATGAESRGPARARRIIWYSSAPTQRRPPVSQRPFQVLGLQQIAVGAPSKDALRKIWVDMLGLTPKGNFRSEKENVDEDIAEAGHGPYAVEVDLMEPIDPDCEAQGPRAGPQPRRPLDRRPPRRRRSGSRSRACASRRGASARAPPVTT